MLDLAEFLRARLREAPADAGLEVAFRLIDQYEAEATTVAGEEDDRTSINRDTLGAALRLMAAPHAAHPDYHPEWRPPAAGDIVFGYDAADWGTVVAVRGLEAQVRWSGGPASWESLAVLEVQDAASTPEWWQPSPPESPASR